MSRILEDFCMLATRGTGSPEWSTSFVDIGTSFDFFFFGSLAAEAVVSDSPSGCDSFGVSNLTKCLFKYQANSSGTF